MRIYLRAGVDDAAFWAFACAKVQVVVFCALMKALRAYNAASLRLVDHWAGLCRRVGQRSGQKGDDLIPRLVRKTSALGKDKRPKVTDVQYINAFHRSANFDKSPREAKDWLDRQPAKSLRAQVVPERVGLAPALIQKILEEFTPVSEQDVVFFWLCSLFGSWSPPGICR